MSTFRLRDLDIFYISFDEPNSEVNWQRVLFENPQAKRVHGVIGFDKAHKVCAAASTMRRFVTIDGDNWLMDGALDQVIDDTGMRDACFSFKSQNVINGLEYGNGGLKVWDKDTLLASNTHESAGNTDFCWDIRYYQVDVLASNTVTNCSPFQAWRAGYREGVKMSYIEGQPLRDFRMGWRDIWKGNLSRLAIWCSIGRDVENGIWAMLGARQGLLDLYGKGMNPTMINDYIWFQKYWTQISHVDPDALARDCARELGTVHDFFIPEFDGKTSLWFKMAYVNPPRHGLMR